MSDKYIVAQHKNIVKVFNSKTGFLVKSFTLPGEIVNGPIQSGDVFTVILNNNGKVQGKIFKLPTCFLQKSFNVS